MLQLTQYCPFSRAYSASISICISPARLGTIDGSHHGRQRIMLLGFTVKELGKKGICLYVCTNSMMQTQSKHISHAYLAQLANGSHLVYSETQGTSFAYNTFAYITHCACS